MRSRIGSHRLFALRAPDIFDFHVKEEVGGTQFGVISIPKLAHTELSILDGQHRTLGIHMAIRDIAEDLSKARSGLAAAERNQAEPAVVSMFEKQIRELNEQRERFACERTSVQIYIEVDSIAYKQMFVHR